jgi:hypothetical protein
MNNTTGAAWGAGMSNDTGRIVAGGMVGIRQTAGIVNIKNSIALGEKTLTLIPASAEIGSLVNIPNDPHNGKYKIQLPDMTSLYFDSPQPARNYSGETGRLIGSHGESVFDYAAVFGVTDPQSPRTVCAFNNNLARINMLTGFDAVTTAATAAAVPGDTNQKEGGGKILDEFKQKSVWTALGFNETVWDLSGVPQGKWPTLR